MRRAKFVIFFIALMLVVTFLVGCTGEKQESKLKVALLQFGDIGDYGWTYEAHVGGQVIRMLISGFNPFSQ
jgi:basic membrane lipoprotein Med (substrate-binding protein (PBP1-ABC) superfamily)